ncbi:hypothetical protein Emag_002387 [Eimeria magna]
MRPHLESFAESREAVSGAGDDEALRGALFEGVSKEARVSRTVKRFWPFWTAMFSVAVAASLLFLMVRCFHAVGLASDREAPGIDAVQKGRRLSAFQAVYCEPRDAMIPKIPSWGLAGLTRSDENNNTDPPLAGGPVNLSKGGYVGGHGSEKPREAPAAFFSPELPSETSQPPRKKLKKSPAESEKTESQLHSPSPSAPQDSPQAAANEPSTNKHVSSKMLKWAITRELVRQSGERVRNQFRQVALLGKPAVLWWATEDGEDDVFE